jgi:YVTN family beta-propeller protein
MRLVTSVVLGMLAVVVLASATAAPAAEPDATTHKCKRGFVHAVIAGKHTCLKAGQRCTRRLDRPYHRYGFHCHTGRLTKAPKPKPPTPSQPIVRVTGTFTLTGTAVAVTVGEGAVWVRVDAGGVAALGETVQRVNPDSGQLGPRIAVGEGVGIAAGEGGVWAPNLDSETVSRIDARTNTVTATIPLRGTDPTSVAAGLGAVWVGIDNAEGVSSTVERIDPAANAVVASISDERADIGLGIAADAGAVWTGGAPNVTRIDPATNRVVARISASRGGDLAADAGAVWSASGIAPQFGSGLLRIDPATNAAVTTISISNSRTAGVAIGFDSVWTTTGRLPGTQSPFVLARVDPRTNSVVGTFGLEGTADVAVGFGAIWVAVGNTLLRLEPVS